MPEQHLKSLQQAFPPRKLSFLLAIVVALTPFAVDMYLPAMPAMARYLATGIEQVEVSLQVPCGGAVLVEVALVHVGMHRCTACDELQVAIADDATRRS